MNYQDKEIKEMIRDTYEPLTFSWQKKERMIRLLSGKEEEKNMKTRSIKRLAVVAAVCVMAVGGTVFAANTGVIDTFMTSGSSRPEYTSFADLEKAEKKAGLDIDAIEDFQNTDFSFESINVEDTKGLDEDGKTILKWKTVDIVYRDKAGREIWLTAEPYGVVNSDPGENSVSERICNGTPVYYSRDEYLLLPSDREGELPDEAAQRLETDPHFFVSYGTEKEETEFFANVQWIRGETRYLLHSSDDVNEEELYTMAEELLQ